jgi:hypothetical protein
MPKRLPKLRRKNYRAPESRDAVESRASEAATIGWTVSVTSVFAADLIVIAVHLYVRGHPDAHAARGLEAIMLLSGALMGAASLALLAAVWRTRCAKPPRGYVVFAVFVAAAPVIVLMVRLFV